MSRNIDAAVITELAKDDFNMSFLVRLDFPSPLVFTSAAHSITWATSPWGSVKFLSDGHFKDISEVRESNELRINSLKLTLTGADQAYISAFLSGDYMDMDIDVYLCVYDDAYAIIGDPVGYFNGNVTGFSIDEKKSDSKIMVECSSHWANFEVISGNRTNDTSQQAEFSGDLGMEFAPVAGKGLLWGRN